MHKNARTFRLVHCSDPHVSRVALTQDYADPKAAAGLLAVLFVRRWRFPTYRLESLLRFLNRMDFDHLLVSGDVVSSGIEKEYLTAGNLFRRFLPDPSRVTVLPGNHEAYSKKALLEKRFDKAFSAYGPGIESDGLYPHVKKIGENVLFIGLNSARIRPVGDATGKVSDSQLKRLAAILDARESRNCFRIVANHFPLNRWDGSPDNKSHRLTNFRELNEILEKNGYDLYLHGHIHRNFMLASNEHQQGFICCSGSCTQRSLFPPQQAGFNVYEIQGQRVVRILRYVFKPRDNWEPMVLFDRGTKTSKSLTGSS